MYEYALSDAQLLLVIWMREYGQLKYSRTVMSLVFNKIILPINVMYKRTRSNLNYSFNKEFNILVLDAKLQRIALKSPACKSVWIPSRDTYSYIN